MYTAKIQNSNGDLLTLTGNEPVYQIIDITGLNPPQAQINTSTIVGLDGAIFNSSKLETRNLVLMIKINGDIEANRRQLYNFFRTKDKCVFYYTNNSLNVSIEGYVESVQCDLFTNNETAQISIICPYPYFKSINEILQDSSNVIPHFSFPFSINLDYPLIISEINTNGGIIVYNAAESETGTIIEIDISSAISSIEIKNTSTGDDFILNYSFQQNDKVIINTNKGQKSVMLIRSGVINNLFSALQPGSIFFQLQVGGNYFEYLADGEADSESLYVMFRYYNVYRGV